MRINEFSIQHYGPLVETGRIFLNNFTLFYGENEDGKTLTIDALIKLLLGKSSNIFKKEIQRVEEHPTGYLILEFNSGETLKLDGKHRITDSLNITPEQFRNIFIIRNSDLRIREEPQFYVNTTEHLFNLHSTLIARIREKLMSFGKLARPFSDSDFSDRKEDGKPKTRLQDIENLLEKIGKLQKVARENAYYLLEQEIVRISFELKETEEALSRLGIARQWNKYQKGVQYLSMLEKAQQDLKNLQIFTSEVLERWTKTTQDIQNRSEIIEARLEKIKQLKSELPGIEQKYAAAEKKMKTLSRQKEAFEEKILRKMEDYDEKEKNLEVPVYLFSNLKFIGIIHFTIILIFTVLYFIQANPVWSGLLIASVGTFAAVIGYYYFKYFLPKAKLQKTEAEIKQLSEGVGIRGETLGDIKSRYWELRQEFLTTEEETNETHQKLIELKTTLDSLEQELRELEAKKKESEMEIQQLKQKLQVTSIEELRHKIEARETARHLLKEAVRGLQQEFGTPPEGEIREKIRFWQQQVNDYQPEGSVPKSLQYDEKAVQQLRQKKLQLEGKLESLKDTLLEFRDELKNIEREVNERVLGGEIICEALEDLDFVKERLEQEKSRIQQAAEDARMALRIFEEIESEEQQRIDELFGKKSEVSRIFKQITGGLYEAVSFDMESGNILVHRKDGEILEPAKLSGGTYDQLYLAVRLALGQKLLSDDRGFFILDDPFIKSDIERLKKQLNILQKIAREGWQVLYFSAKKEVRDSLQNAVKKGEVQMIEVPGTLFKAE